MAPALVAQAGRTQPHVAGEAAAQATSRCAALGYSSGDAGTQPQPRLSATPAAQPGAGVGAGLGTVTSRVASTSPKVRYCGVAWEGWDEGKHGFITAGLCRR